MECNNVYVSELSDSAKSKDFEKLTSKKTAQFQQFDVHEIASVGTQCSIDESVFSYENRALHSLDVTAVTSMVSVVESDHELSGTTPCVDGNNEIDSFKHDVNTLKLIETKNYCDVQCQKDEFTVQLDKFLSIPLSDFNKEVPSRMQELMKQKRDDCFSDTSIHKGRYMFSITIFQYLQGKLSSDQAREKLMNARTYLSEKFGYDILLDIKALNHLKCYRDILYGVAVPKKDRDDLLSILFDELSEIFPDITTTHESIIDSDEALIKCSYDFHNIDLFSLKLLVMNGILPSLTEYKNLSDGFFQIENIVNFCKCFTQYMSPVSFSYFDLMRYGLQDPQYASKIVKDYFSPVENTINFFLFHYVFKLFTFNNKSPVKLSLIGPEIIQKRKTALLQLTNMCCRMAEWRADISKFKNERARYPADVSYLRRSMHHLCGLLENEKNKKINEDSKSLFEEVKVLIKVSFYRETKKTLKIRHWNVMGNIANESVKECPSLSLLAFKLYAQGRNWSKASESADQYAKLFQGIDDSRMEYWLDVSRRMNLMQECEQQEQIRKINSQSEEKYDVNKIIESLIKEGVISTSDNPADKSLPDHSDVTDNIQYDSSNDLDHFEDDNFNDDEKQQKSDKVKSHVDQSNSVLSYHSDEQKWTTVNKINKSKKKLNNDSTDSIAWHKLLKRNRNPEINILVWLMHVCRENFDLEAEEQVFKRLMLVKNKTGKERLLLERGWTELHKFDSVFQTGVVIESLRRDGKKYLDHALNDYFFPVLSTSIKFTGYHTPFDIRSPSEIKRIVSQVAEQIEAVSQEDGHEIRYWFRCIFSSIGHAYSLLSMICTDNNSHKRHACMWYELKTIDHQYMASSSMPVGV